MKKSPTEQIKELKKRIEVLESSVLILNTTIDIADEQLNTNIRKKYLSQQLSGLKHVKRKKQRKD